MQAQSSNNRPPRCMVQAHSVLPCRSFDGSPRRARQSGRDMTAREDFGSWAWQPGGSVWRFGQLTRVESRQALTEATHDNRVTSWRATHTEPGGLDKRRRSSGAGTENNAQAIPQRQAQFANSRRPTPRGHPMSCLWPVQRHSCLSRTVSRAHPPTRGGGRGALLGLQQLHTVRI